MDHFHDLQLRGPVQGYYPEPTRIILVLAKRNVPRAKDYFRGMGIKVFTVRRYLGRVHGGEGGGGELDQGEGGRVG